MLKKIKLVSFGGLECTNQADKDSNVTTLVTITMM